ncbi:MAG: hypothetical protein HFJ85_07120 [Oscillospiraceae bacterium]|nr:hypothetical protein [Oscillospiraceae bacterium]
MQERIYTIPISEVFEPKEGCPICRMRDILEERCVEYITGAAMMEPDVRVETNRLGFCKDHFEMMRARKNRLSLALILETRLAEVHKELFEKKGILGKKQEKREPTCYVCQKIDSVMEGMIGNLLKLFSSDADFRRLFSEQEAVCLPHYELLMGQAARKLSKKQLPAFKEALDPLTERYLAALTEDVHFFTTRFDYRFGGKDAEWGNSKDSIERAIWFLTSRK